MIEPFDSSNNGFSSFTVFSAGDTNASDPDRGRYSGTLQWHNLARGFRPRPAGFDSSNNVYVTPEPYLDPTTIVVQYSYNADMVNDLNGILANIASLGTSHPWYYYGFNLTVGGSWGWKNDVVIGGTFGADDLKNILETINNYPVDPSGLYGGFSWEGWATLERLVNFGYINNLSSSTESKFPLSGNVVTQEGWIDGEFTRADGTTYGYGPGDRRMVMTQGPFEMNIGDTVSSTFVTYRSQSVNMFNTIVQTLEDSDKL